MGLSSAYGLGLLQPGVCTSSTRPASPRIGQMIYETDTRLMKIYTADGWSTGTYHNAGFAVDVFLVGGGGGGATSLTGGAGGGGVIYATNVVLSDGEYVITVGAGGTSDVNTDQNSNTGGTKGGSSSAFNITATGGGASWTRLSTTYHQNANCTTGANGGGGSADGVRTGALGVAPTLPSGVTGTVYGGFSGGTGGGVGTNYPGGGGAGAGANGVSPANGDAKGGDGGSGVIAVLDGLGFFYGGGGGGSTFTGANGAGAGGLGGGGGGGDESGGGGGTGGQGRNNGGTGGTGAGSAGGAGGANTGGGGGAGAHQTGRGGNGGSGIVIIRYLTSSATGKTINGGTPGTFGAYTVRTFLTSGSFSVA